MKFLKTLFHLFVLQIFYSLRSVFINDEHCIISEKGFDILNNSSREEINELIRGKNK